ncbi:MAG: hypothetical protein ACYCYI_09730 [Saccharofermentanales bacterium]
MDTDTENFRAKNIIGTIFGIIEILIAFRFIFKLFGAYNGNVFVKFVNFITGFFVNVFQGIFPKTSVGKVDSTAIFEPSSVIAMVVIALVAVLTFKIMAVIINKKTRWISKTRVTRETDVVSNQDISFNEKESIV